MKGLSPVLASLLLVILALSSALLLHTWVFQISPRPSASVSVAPTLVGASAAGENNTTVITLFLQNTQDVPFSLADARAVIEGDGRTFIADVNGCNSVPSGGACEVYVVHPLPSGSYDVWVYAEGTVFGGRVDVPPSAASPGFPADLAVSSVSADHGLSFAPPEANRYDGVLFYGEHNAFVVHATVKNASGGDVYEAVVRVYVSGALAGSCTVSVPAGGTATCDVPTTTSGIGSLDVNAVVDYPLDTNGDNDSLAATLPVDALVFCTDCNGCFLDANTYWTDAKNVGRQVIIVLASDVSCTSGHTLGGPTVLDGNGHAMNVSGSGYIATSYNSFTLRNISVSVSSTFSYPQVFNVQYPSEILYTSLSSDAAASVVRGAAALSLRASTLSLTAGTALELLSDANVEDVNITLSGGAVGLALSPILGYTPRLRLRDVNISGGSPILTHYEVDTFYTPPVPVEAVNAVCGGRNILVVDASNAVDYNGTPLDPSTICFVSVVGVDDLNLAFTGSADVNGAFMLVTDSNVTVTGLHIDTWAGYHPLAEIGPHGIVVYGNSRLSLVDSDINVHADDAVPLASAGDVNIVGSNLRALADYTYALYASSSINALLKSAVVEANGLGIYSLYYINADVDLSESNTYICGGFYLSTVTCTDCNSAGTCICPGRIVTTETVDCPCVVSVSASECLR